MRLVVLSIKLLAIGYCVTVPYGAAPPVTAIRPHVLPRNRLLINLFPESDDAHVVNVSVTSRVKSIEPTLSGHTVEQTDFSTKIIKTIVIAGAIMKTPYARSNAYCNRLRHESVSRVFHGQ